MPVTIVICMELADSRADLLQAFINAVLLKEGFWCPSLSTKFLLAKFGLSSILELILFRGGELRFLQWHLKCGVNLSKLGAVYALTCMLGLVCYRFECWLGES